jgi:hypothetical protein
MVNHIPNCGLFTNKLNLLCSLQAYEKLQMQSTNKAPHFIPLEDYLPLTYKLDDRIDKETFFNTAKSKKTFLHSFDSFYPVYLKNALILAVGRFSF